MSPNKTIYIREADQELWNKVEKLAGTRESLSGVVAEALRRYVAEIEEAKALEPADAWDRVFYTLGKIEELKERCERDLQRMKAQGRLFPRAHAGRK
jgi:hypothetical protein